MITTSKKWKVRYLIRILKFQITLLKEHFSIKKWHNILSIILIVLAVFVGYRLAFVAIGNYNSIALIISTFMYCFIFRTVFPKQVESKCNTVRIFFPKINIDKYRTFQYHYKYVIYEIILCYLILPYNIENYPFFAFILAILHIFMFFIATIKRYLKASSYNFAMTATVFSVCLLTLLYNRDIITIPNFLLNNIWFFSGCILLTLILAIQIYRYLTPVVGFTSSVFYINKTKNNKLLSKNKDLLYIIRTNKFIEPIIIILISATISKYLQEHISDMIFTNLFSYAYAYIYIYIY